MIARPSTPALPRPFHALWAAHTVSQFGTQITLLALPLTALGLLNATPFHMGVLAALGSLPNLLFSLPAGVWVDRHDKKRIMIAGDLARAALLLAIPLAVHFSALHFEMLLLVAFLVGTAGVFFDLASAAVLPALLGRALLVPGNARMEASRSTAAVTGPTLAGLLISAVGAPLALLLDVASFVCSALFLTRMPRIDAPQTTAAQQRGGVWTDALAGLHALRERPLLGALVRSMGLWNFAVGLSSGVFVLFLTRSVGLTPSQLGVVLTAQGVGMLAGTALVGPLQRRFPLGRVLMAFAALALLCAYAGVTAPLFSPAWRFPVLLGVEFLSGVGYMVFAILASSTRAAATPAELQARVAAVFRFLIMGGLPIGALLGGAIAGQVSPAAALLTTASGMLLAWLWLLGTTVPRLKVLPEA